MMLIIKKVPKLVQQTNQIRDKRLYLSVDEHNRAQETPGPSLPVHVEHSQDLQEANSPGKITGV